MRHRALRGALLSAILSLCLLAPLAGQIAPARGQDSNPPLPVAAPGAHPRLLLTQDYIDETLRPRAAQRQPGWLALQAYVDSDQPEADAAAHADSALRALAVAWLVTGKPDYAARALALLEALRSRVASAPTMTGEGGLSTAFFEDVAALAIGYDWLYAALDDAARAEPQDTLRQAAKRLRDPAADPSGLIWVEERPRAFTSASAQWLWALTASALALQGDTIGVNSLVDFAGETLNNTTLPALDLQEGGAWAEGPQHGFIGGWALAQTALAWWTATGENVFNASAWWYDRLAYDLFLYRPGSTTVSEGGASGPAHDYPAHDYPAHDYPAHDYPAIVGDTARQHPDVFYGRAQDVLLRAAFAGSDHADWMDWFLAQPPADVPGWLAVEEFLWRQPGYGGLPPAPRTWIAPYNGHVFMRSRWFDAQTALDSGATVVTFTAGDHLTAAQYYDQGSFTIARGGSALAVRSGVFGSGDSDHDANWLGRTIAANAILICNPAETFDGIRVNRARSAWLNDCGQRAMTPFPPGAIDVEHLVANWQPYDTGSLTRYGEIGEVTYLRADVTGAYNSTFFTASGNAAKVSLVLRELIYWRPDLVIVADRAVTTDPAYTPQTVVHFQAEPLPEGLFYRVAEGDSALYLQNLLPNSRVTVTRGYEVAGEPVAPEDGAEYGVYRLAVTPGAPQTDTWFLSALVAQSAEAAAPAAGTLVLGEGVRGVALGTRQVLFALDAGDGADLTEAAFPIAPGIEYTLVTGLRPGAAYTIALEGSGARTDTADDAGTLLLANVLPGQVRLTLAE